MDQPQQPQHPPMLKGGPLETGFLFGFGFFLAGVVVVGLVWLLLSAAVFHTLVTH